MSTTPLDALLQALRASPGNLALQAIVVQACIDQGDELAFERVFTEFGDALHLDERTRARAIAFAMERHQKALAARLVAEDPAQQLLQTAREQLAEGDREGARETYERALALNPTLDDPMLAGALSGKVVSFPEGAAGRRLRTVANDDTSREDAVRLLHPPAERVAFADVGGLDDVKQQIRRKIITPFLKPSLFDRFKRRAGGGILMYGPPGCGKTLLARATAGECGARFLNVAITDVLDMYIGESERKLHALFEEARRSAPAVMFFDELEALGGKRQHSRDQNGAKLASQFLTELDGFAQENKGVLILGATNVPWAVDAAFRRPGRFDRVLFVPPPDAPARTDILSNLLEGRPVSGPIDCAELARLTPGFSGADLRHLVETAVDEAIEASIAAGVEEPVSMVHLRAALAQTRPTTLEWLTSARNHARYANQGGQYDEVLAFLDKHGTRG
jgi:transitional endoplasmic reticulum ATPase